MSTPNPFDQFDNTATADAGNPFDQFDTDKPTEATAPDETVARVAGLAGRAVLKGTGDLVGVLPAAADAMSLDPVGAQMRKAADAANAPPGRSAPYTPQLSDFVHPDKWAQAAQYFADKASDKANLPIPATPIERIASKAVEALPSAVLAPEAPVLGALSAAAGGGASQGAKEAGWGPVAQTFAGLAAGSVPAVAANSGAISARARRRLC